MPATVILAHDWVYRRRCKSVKTQHNLQVCYVFITFKICRTHNVTILDFSTWMWLLSWFNNFHQCIVSSSKEVVQEMIFFLPPDLNISFFSFSLFTPKLLLPQTLHCFVLCLQALYKGATRVILATENDYCKLCDASFSSPAVAQAHYQGKNHAKKLRLAEAQQNSNNM